MKLRLTDRDLSRNIYPLNRYLEVYNDTPISRVVYTYFNTGYCNHIYLDDFGMLIVEHYSMDVSEVCSLLNEFEDTGRVMQRGKKSYFRHQWKTLNSPAVTVSVEFGKKYRLRYLEYDYIGHQFYVEDSEM